MPRERSTPACGFELVGIEREVGRKFNRWLSVAVMQKML
jgi:L-amino acid N-acyltransferase